MTKDKNFYEKLCAFTKPQNFDLISLVSYIFATGKTTSNYK